MIEYHIVKIGNNIERRFNPTDWGQHRHLDDFGHLHPPGEILGTDGCPAPTAWSPDGGLAGAISRNGRG